MIPIDKAVSVKYVKGKMHFEVLVDAELANKFKAGQNVDLNDVLAIDEVFLDSRKGLRASKKDLQEAFDTTDREEAIAKIIKEGKIYSTEAQRDKVHDDKWEKLVATISTSAVDGKTNLPIPQKTIEAALHKALFRLDNRKVEDQIPDAIKALRKLMPLGFKHRTVQITVGVKSARSCMDVCRNLGTITRENKDADGSVKAVIEVPAGLREELIDKLNAITKGDIELQLLD